MPLSENELKQIEQDAREYAESSSSDIDEQMLSFYAYRAAAVKYQSEVEELKALAAYRKIKPEIKP